MKIGATGKITFTKKEAKELSDVIHRELKAGTIKKPVEIIDKKLKKLL
jgi:hypothetical protein